MANGPNAQMKPDTGPWIFYGSWRVSVTAADNYPRQSFTISGSANADGQYRAPHDQPFFVDVDGDQWAIYLHWEWFTRGRKEPYWEDSGAERRMKFVPGQGLTVELDSGAGHEWTITPWHYGMLLTCVSRDPSTSPPPGTTPPEFTLPKG